MVTIAQKPPDLRACLAGAAHRPVADSLTYERRAPVPPITLDFLAGGADCTAYPVRDFLDGERLWRTPIPPRFIGRHFVGGSKNGERSVSRLDRLACLLAESVQPFGSGLDLGSAHGTFQLQACPLFSQRIGFLIRDNPCIPHGVSIRRYEHTDLLRCALALMNEGLRIVRDLRHQLGIKPERVLGGCSGRCGRFNVVM